MPLFPQTKTTYRPMPPPAARKTPPPPAKPLRSLAPPAPKPKLFPTTPPSYTAQAQADLSPVYQAIVDQLNQQRTAGEQGIAGYTRSFANMLGGYNPQAGYNKAAEAQAALDAALQQSLTGTGQNLSQGLAAQLAQINAPGETSSRVIGGLNSATAGATNAGLAKGSATLSALLAQGAAAGGYASSLPGYAAGLGLQQTRLLEGQTATQVAQALANEPKDVLARADQLQSAAAIAAQNQATADYRKAELKQGQERIDATKAAQRATALYRAAQQGIATKKFAHQVWLDSQKLADAREKQSFAEWAKQQGFVFEGQRVSIAQQNANTSAFNATHTKPGKLQHAVVNGHAVTFDPNTGGYYVPGTNTPVDPATLTKPPKPPTAAALGKARTFLYQQSHGYFATQSDPDTPLTPSQVRAAQNAGETVGKVTIGQHQDEEIQKVYLELVQKYGIPARQAFQMVAGQYPQWGKSHQSYFPKAAAADGGVRVEGATPKDAAAVALVGQYVGTPYVWGGSKPGGFDCSGLLQYVWGREGVSIPRTTYDQWKAGVDVTGSELRPGDAVFFRGSDPRGNLPGHVGMYIGNGRFIESPHTGATVRISNLSSRSDYVGARRYA